MTVNELTSSIKNKFRTMTRFCHASGLEYESMKYFLKRARLNPDDQNVMSEMESIYNLVHSTDPLDSSGFTEELRARLEAKIRDEYKSIYKFCSQHDLKHGSVYRTLCKHTMPTTINPTVNRLITILGIKWKNQ